MAGPCPQIPTCGTTEGLAGHVRKKSLRKEVTGEILSSAFYFHNLNSPHTLRSYFKSQNDNNPSLDNIL